MLLDNNAVIDQTHLIPTVECRKRIAVCMCVCVRSPQRMVSQFKQEDCSVLFKRHVSSVDVHLCVQRHKFCLLEIILVDTAYGPLVC